MGELNAPAETLRLVGGAPCLDFVNTLGNRNTASANEHLHGYPDLVAWSRHAGLLAPRAAAYLLQEGARRTPEAEQVYRRALVLREALFRLFDALSAGEKPKSQDLAILNGVLEKMSGAHITSGEAGYAWDWTGDEEALDQMLYPVARSAAELLVSGASMRVHKCEGDLCGWLFIDTSKNRTRRWCSMEECGNVAKARRHYRRVRAAAHADPAKHSHPS